MITGGVYTVTKRERKREREIEIEIPVVYMYLTPALHDSAVVFHIRGVDRPPPWAAAERRGAPEDRSR